MAGRKQTGREERLLVVKGDAVVCCQEVHKAEEIQSSCICSDRGAEYCNGLGFFTSSITRGVNVALAWDATGTTTLTDDSQRVHRRASSGSFGSVCTLRRQLLCRLLVHDLLETALAL